MVLLERNDVNEINASHDTASEIPVRELWHVITEVRSIKLGVLLLEIINLFLAWLLGSCLDPERTSVLVVPLSAFEPFEAMDKK